MIAPSPRPEPCLSSCRRECSVWRAAPRSPPGRSFPAATATDDRGGGRWWHRPPLPRSTAFHGGRSAAATAQCRASSSIMVWMNSRTRSRRPDYATLNSCQPRDGTPEPLALRQIPIGAQIDPDRHVEMTRAPWCKSARRILRCLRCQCTGERIDRRLLGKRQECRAGDKPRRGQNSHRCSPWS
jgi:hypothetical protein